MPNEWVKPEHALAFLSRSDKLSFRTEANAALLDEIPTTARRVLDLGTGDGRVLELVLARCPEAAGVAVDLSDAMLEQFRKRFAGRAGVESYQHDLTNPLPALGTFDVVVSSLAIHHLEHPRKRELYAEVFALVAPGGVFCNLDHVASATERRHRQFLAAIGTKPEDEDPSNKLLDVETQLRWLREIGFADVDCLWKWREIALMAAVKPA